MNYLMEAMGPHQRTFCRIVSSAIEPGSCGVRAEDTRKASEVELLAKLRPDRSSKHLPEQLEPLSDDGDGCQIDVWNDTATEMSSDLLCARHPVQS